MPYKDPIKRKEYSDTYKRLIGTTPGVSKERTRRLALEMLGGACPCGVNDPIVLVFDHKGDDGAEDRRKNWAGSLPYRIVRGEVSLSDYQVLCHNCNWRKEYLRRKQCQAPAPNKLN